MAMITDTISTSKTLTFHQALAQAELLTRQALRPELHERLSCAVALVKSGAVMQMDDGAWEVESASVPGKIYSINGHCLCPDATHRAPQGRCKHVLSVLISRKTMQLLAQPPQDATRAVDVQEAPSAHKAVLTGKRVIPAHFLQQLQGKPFVKFVGLLQMAHDEGLQSLTASLDPQRCRPQSGACGGDLCRWAPF